MKRLTGGGAEVARREWAVRNGLERATDPAAQEERRREHGVEARGGRGRRRSAA